MRSFIVLPLVFLTGCSALTERITGQTTAVAKLRSELGADINLRLALQQDYARKNAQLLYISHGRYPCGPAKSFFTDADPDTAGRLNPEALKARIVARTNFLTAKYADFKIVMDYADALTQADNDRAGYAKTVAGIKGLVDTYKGLAPSEFAPVVVALKSGVGLFGTFLEGASLAKIVEIAQTAEEPLKRARQRMIDNGILKSFVEEEGKAFRAWDECALDRLFFMREFDPSAPPSYLSSLPVKKVAGESRSPVILFSAEYRTYLDERSAFIAQRPDYVAAIDAIVKANAAIAHPGEGLSRDDVIKALTEMGATTADVRNQWETIATEAKALKL